MPDSNGRAAAVTEPETEVKDCVVRGCKSHRFQEIQELRSRVRMEYDGDGWYVPDDAVVRTDVLDRLGIFCGRGHRQPE
jgi:hypothetical protein